MTGEEKVKIFAWFVAVASAIVTLAILFIDL